MTTKRFKIGDYEIVTDRLGPRVMIYGAATGLSNDFMLALVRRLEELEEQSAEWQRRAIPSARDCICSTYAYAVGEMGEPYDGHHPRCPVAGRPEFRSPATRDTEPAPVDVARMRALEEAMPSRRVLELVANGAGCMLVVDCAAYDGRARELYAWMRLASAKLYGLATIPQPPGPREEAENDVEWMRAALIALGAEPQHVERWGFFNAERPESTRVCRADHFRRGDVIGRGRCKKEPLEGVVRELIADALKRLLMPHIGRRTDAEARKQTIDTAVAFLLPRMTMLEELLGGRFDVGDVRSNGYELRDALRRGET